MKMKKCGHYMFSSPMSLGGQIDDTCDKCEPFILNCTTGFDNSSIQRKRQIALHLARVGPTSRQPQTKFNAIDKEIS